MNKHKILVLSLLTAVLLVGLLFCGQALAEEARLPAPEAAVCHPYGSPMAGLSPVREPNGGQIGNGEQVTQDQTISGEATPEMSISSSESNQA
ncbi:MAG: hypothetical protein AB1466_06330 [Actinomycetota bacterium]